MPVSPACLVFIALLAIAAGTDFFRYRIPNWIVLALVAVFLVQAVRHIHEVSWLNQGAAGALCLLAGLAFYTLNQLGAGDAKLLAVLALWSGLQALVPVLLLISVVGVVFAGLLLVVRWVMRRRNLDTAAWPKSLRSGEGIPYGVAIALGSVLGARFFPVWLWN